jgi:hypothetical protein
MVMKCIIVQLILAEEIGNWSKYCNVDDCFVCWLCSDFAVGLAGPKWKMRDVTTFFLRPLYSNMPTATVQWPDEKNHDML